MENVSGIIGGGIMKEDASVSIRGYRGSIWEASRGIKEEASGRHLGSIWEASGRHLEASGAIWEASGRHPP